MKASRTVVLNFALAAISMSVLATALAARAPEEGPLPHEAWRGVELFRTKGCYECHGYAAQGAIGVGARLSPPRYAAEGFRAYVRKPAGQMPPYSAKLLPDADVADIFSYLQDMPPAPPASGIRLLAGYVSATGPRGGKGMDRTVAAVPASAAPPTGGTAIDGGKLYQQHCAACHGTSLEGGVGPSLNSVAASRSFDQILGAILSPKPPMPKLSPTPLSAVQVRTIAGYVKSKEAPNVAK